MSSARAAGCLHSGGATELMESGLVLTFLFCTSHGCHSPFPLACSTPYAGVQNSIFNSGYTLGSQTWDSWVEIIYPNADEWYRLLFELVIACCIAV